MQKKKYYKLHVKKNKIIQKKILEIFLFFHL